MQSTLSGVKHRVRSLIATRDFAANNAVPMEMFEHIVMARCRSQLPVKYVSRIVSGMRKY